MVGEFFRTEKFQIFTFVLPIPFKLDIEAANEYWPTWQLNSNSILQVVILVPRSWRFCLLNANILLCQVSLEYCPHIIFKGPPGSGKRSLCRAVLNEIFGDSSLNVQT